MNTFENRTHATNEMSDLPINAATECSRRGRSVKRFVGISLFALTFSASGAFAGPKGHSSVDYAKVTKIEEITRTVEYSTPTQKCWTEQVRHERPSHREQSYTGTVLGGIIGGAIGNAVGHKKRNKQVGTAVGAILGATIGNDISNRRHGHYESSPSVVYRDEQRCEIHHDVSYKEEVIGYRVWYKYHGEEYKTRMDERPGKRIKVRVNVQPI